VRQISALHIAVASLLKEQQVKYNIFWVAPFANKETVHREYTHV
jgi:hypothetical protein